jgi:hypothetical protein
VAACIYFDRRLGGFPYTGFKAGDRRPIGVDAVRNGGFCVSVAGKGYGKGSSREHSPAAEKVAGVACVCRMWKRSVSCASGAEQITADPAPPESAMTSTPIMRTRSARSVPSCCSRLRRLRQLRTRLYDPCRSGDGQRHQSQFSRALRPRTSLAREPPTVAASAIAGELISFDELRARYS